MAVYVTELEMKKAMLIAFAAICLTLSGCSATTEPQGLAGSDSQAASPAAQEVTKISMPLRSHSAEQIVTVLRSLRDGEGKAPSFITDDASIREQVAGTSKAQTSVLSRVQVLPERCSSFLDLASSADSSLIRGMGMVGVNGAFASIGIVLDETGGHKKRIEESKALLNDCGEVTLRSAENEASMSMKLLPLESSAEDGFAMSATANAPTQTKIVGVTAASGSVLVNAVAISSDVLLADFEETAALKSLRDLAEQALDKFAGLPESSAEATVRASGSAAEVKLRNALTGSWSGPVTGDNSAYHVEATISQNATGLVATVSYPELNCTATWTETGIGSQDVDMLERVQTGHSRCADNVKLSLLSVANTNVIVAFESKTKPNLKALMKPE
ncbi:hypothetical protein [Paenarthrobacter sp. YJN-5]|uniref:hypothetical protein n=1 Tax=Paenarthrobacter sp. YJN-5 TaxID=2735316 RepID=UPI001878AC36|nr:hypothetical protein [Paenarthrobacter sp. YJN-5]QOT19313.1 hypothetical protein HMI59_21895 [Paenarthrobacter sp. YJN-5]